MYGSEKAHSTKAASLKKLSTSSRKRDLPTKAKALYGTRLQNTAVKRTRFSSEPTAIPPTLPQILPTTATSLKQENSTRLSTFGELTTTAMLPV